MDEAYLPSGLTKDMIPNRALMPVLVTESGDKVPICDLLLIDPTTLIQDLQIQPSWQAAVSYQCTLQEVRVSRLEREVDKTEAQLSIDHRNKIKAATGKAPGVETVKSYVLSDPILTNVQNKLFEAREKLGAWKAAISALHARRECMINMGAEVRIDKKATAG